MSFSTDEIKQAINHSSQAVRDRAIRYFTQASSQDPALFPEVIRAWEAYTHQGAFSNLMFVRGVQLDQQNLDWVLKTLGEKLSSEEVSQEKLEETAADSLEQIDEYLLLLQLILAESNVALLKTNQSAIEEQNGLAEDVRYEIEQRIALTAADAAECWEQLIELSAKNKEAEYVSDSDLELGDRLLEVVARDQSLAVEKIGEVLAEDLESYEGNPRALLHIFAVQLAGLIQHEEVVPILLAKMEQDVQWLDEEIAQTLVKIGGEKTVAAIADVYADSPWYMRYYLAGCLEHLHSENLTETLLQLYPVEEELAITQRLVGAMISQFSVELIEPAKVWLQKQPVTHERIALRRDLAEMAKLLGAGFPEVEAWIQEFQQVQTAGKQWVNPEFSYVNTFDPESISRPQRRRQVRQRYWGPHRRQLPIVESLISQRSAQRRFAKVPVTGAKIRKNDPCPCGSGQKYKHCCQNRPAAGQFFRP